MTKPIISVTIPQDLVAQLDAAAEEEFRSRSSLIVALIARGLEQRREVRQEQPA